MFGFLKKGRQAEWQEQDRLAGVRVEFPSEGVIREALDAHPEAFLTASELELIKSAATARAIESYMGRTGASLKDSEDLIAAVERRLA